MYTFAHYVYPKSVPSFNDNGFVKLKLREVNVRLKMYTFAHYVYPKSVPSFNDNGIVEMKLREVNVRLKMYTLHIMCTRKVCLLSTTMESWR